MIDRANLIVFLSDNHSRKLLGCLGHPIVRTPSIDKIGLRGVRFTNTYCASPLCCPSRAAIATGRYPHVTGYWDNAIVYDGRVPSWMHRLREAGHAVISVGKLHFRSSDDDNGFSEEIAPLHIVDGVGGLTGLLRWNEPVRAGTWEMYTENSGVGETDYQDYDRKITAEAVAQLRKLSNFSGKPWVLFVSYVSPHPPFLVPDRLLRLYPQDKMPLPTAFRPGERPRHPAVEQFRRVFDVHDFEDDETVKRITAAYFGLITHLDEQIGVVMAAAEELGVLHRTRVMYTSDHGEMFGNLGLLAKSQLYEPSAGVPLVMSGPGIPRGRVVRELCSLVDLFPTIVESVGGAIGPEDDDLSGTTLWPAIKGMERDRQGFAEYHAAGSMYASYMLRCRDSKLIYHVHWPNQLFDLSRDPNESEDLVECGEQTALTDGLVKKLRKIVDPEAVDRRAKADQVEHVKRNGGERVIRAKGSYTHTPPPGAVPEYQGQEQAESVER